MSHAQDPQHQHGETFQHEALLYAGEREFMDGALAFLREGLERDEPSLVAVSAARIGSLRECLGDDAERVQFVDMAAVGANPARIIPAWRTFVDARPEGAGLRGIGEPIWAERSEAELAECQRHEALLNLAFAGTERFTLLCPYDTERLEPEVIEEARRTHPVVIDGGVAATSTSYGGLEHAQAPHQHRLSPAPADADELAFDAARLPTVRAFVRNRCRPMLSQTRLADLTLAVNELATNSTRHGGGSGLLRIWDEPATVVCEVADAGSIDQPLAGRESPLDGQVGGFGLWLVNQLCDLVQVRVLDSGGVVRVHMRSDLR
jgi:anti-sigma regulatory factor (Ser/Thr protein kinase)